MAGADKMRLLRLLEEKGWVNVGDGWDMKPPENFFEDIPEMFSLIDAKILQEILGEQIEEDDENESE